MISFKNIRSYGDFKSYQRIKQVQVKQCVNQYSSKKQCGFSSYQDYLNKKVGYQCCTKGQDCCYCLNGKNKDGTNCLNPSDGKVCCGCENNEMKVSN